MGLFGRKKGVHAGRASALIEAGAVVVDVREQAEWNAGHIPAAIHLPLGEIARRHAGLRVENLEGGMNEWKKSGLPMALDDGVVA